MEIKYKGWKKITEQEWFQIWDKIVTGPHKVMTYHKSYDFQWHRVRRSFRAKNQWVMKEMWFYGTSETI